LGSALPDGLTLAQLAQTVRLRSGQDTDAYSARNAAYDAANMLGKKPAPPDRAVPSLRR